MCTLIVATGVWPELPLVVAANRDEALGRASAGFSLHEDRPIPVYAPQDLVSGGTWMGLNAAGLFVGITNRAGTAPDPTRRSRGLVVRDALCHGDARSAATAIATVGAADHNPFHLVMADLESAHLVWVDGDTVRHEELSAGLHVITERSFDAAPTERPAMIRGRLASLEGADYPGTAYWQALLSTRNPDAPFEGVCIVDAGVDYGTRSSTILERGPEHLRLLDHQGPPVNGDWVDLSEQAQALLAAQS